MHDGRPLQGPEISGATATTNPGARGGYQRLLSRETTWTGARGLPGGNRRPGETAGPGEATRETTDSGDHGEGPGEATRGNRDGRQGQGRLSGWP